MSPRHIGLLAALSAVWGGSYLLIKYGLEDLEPAVIVWVRLVLAAVVLYAVMRLRGGGAEARAAHAELRARPGRALLLGTVAIALPFNLITFGELEVPSGLTAVLIAPRPGAHLGVGGPRLGAAAAQAHDRVEDDRGEHEPHPHDHGRLEVLERVLDQQVRAAPDGGEGGKEPDLAWRHEPQCHSDPPPPPMKVRRGGYQPRL